MKLAWSAEQSANVPSADSPQPGAVPSSSKSSQNLVTTIRQQVAGGGRASSPIESFSFGNRAVEEVSPVPYWAAKALPTTQHFEVCSFSCLHAGVPSAVFLKLCG